MACDISKQIEGLNALKDKVKDNTEAISKINHLTYLLGKRLPNKNGVNLSEEQIAEINTELGRIADKTDLLLEQESELKASLLDPEMGTKDLKEIQSELEDIKIDLAKLDTEAIEEAEKLKSKNSTGDVILNQSKNNTALNSRLAKDKLEDFFKSKPVTNMLAYTSDIFGDGFDNVLDMVGVNPKDKGRYDSAKELVNSLEAGVRYFVANDLAKKTESWEVDSKGLSGPRLQSPSRFLILKGNKLPEEVVTAMAVASADMLSSLKDMRGSSRSLANSKRLLGIDTSNPISEAQLKSIKDVDGFLTTEAETLGNNIYKTLGLKAKPGYGATEAKLKIELGMMAIYSMKDLVEVKKVDENADFAAGSTILSFTDKGNNLLDDDRNLVSANARRALEVMNIKANQDLPKYDAPTRSREVKIDSESKGYTNLSQTHQDAINKHESVPYSWNERFIESYEGMITEDRNRLERILGVIEDEGTVHITKRLGVKGKNNAIKADMRNLEEQVTDMREKGVEKMFFGWKVIKSLRFYMKSSTFNPQGKKLHRFSSYAGEPSIITDKTADDQLLSMALAFHLKVDKKSKDTILKEWGTVEEKLNKMLDLDASDLDILEAFSEGNGEVAHLLGGIVEYKAYRQYKESNNGSIVGFKSMLQAETDAVTSGFILKIMQMPLIGDGTAGLANYLAKGGIFVADENGKFKYESYGKMAEEKGYVDSYQGPAKILTDKMRNMAKNVVKQAGKDKIDAKTKVASTEAAAKLALGVKQSDTITEIARNFMKNPFMIFNYGAGLTKINEAIAVDALDNLYTMMESKDNFDEVVKTIRAAGGKDAGKVLNELTHENMIETKLPTEVENEIKDNVKYGLGRELEDTFKKEYKVYVEATNNINNTFTMMFRLFKVKLDKAIKEEQYRLGAIPTEEEVDRLARTLTTNEFNKNLTDIKATKGISTPTKQDVADAQVAESRKLVIREKARQQLFKENKGKKKTRKLTAKETNAVIGKLKDNFPAIKTALATAEDELIFINKTAKVRDKEFDKGDKALETSMGKIRLESDPSASIYATPSVYELVEAFSSGGVGTIHGLDASLQAVVLSTYETLGVHDANMFMAHNVKDGTRLYNKATLELSKSYSITKELANSMKKSLANSDDGDRAYVNHLYEMDHQEFKAKYPTSKREALTIDSISKDMEGLNSRVQVARKRLFSRDLRSAHAAYEGAEAVMKAEEIQETTPKEAEKSGSQKSEVKVEESSTDVTELVSVIPNTGKDTTIITNKIKALVKTQGKNWWGKEVAWFGPTDYAYSGKKHKQADMPPIMKKLADRAAKLAGKEEGYYNSVLINVFPKGKGITAHPDNETELRLKDGTIGSITIMNLGGSSKIDISENNTGNIVQSVTIKDGEIYTMPAGDFQDKYKHAVGQASDERVSVTFRRVEVTEADNNSKIIKKVRDNTVYYKYEDKHTTKVSGPANDGAYHIEDVWTHEDYRGKGIATKVMSRVIQDLGSNYITLDAVSLDKGVSQKALNNFYAKFGFKRLDVKDEYDSYYMGREADTFEEKQPKVNIDKQVDEVSNLDIDDYQAEHLRSTLPKEGEVGRDVRSVGLQKISLDNEIGEYGIDYAEATKRLESDPENAELLEDQEFTESQKADGIKSHNKNVKDLEYKIKEWLKTIDMIGGMRALKTELTSELEALTKMYAGDKPRIQKETKVKTDKQVGEVFNWTVNGKKTPQNYKLVNIEGDKGTFENTATGIQRVKPIDDKRWVRVEETTDTNNLADFMGDFDKMDEDEYIARLNKLPKKDLDMLRKIIAPAKLVMNSDKNFTDTVEKSYHYFIKTNKILSETLKELVASDEKLANMKKHQNKLINEANTKAPTLTNKQKKEYSSEVEKLGHDISIHQSNLEYDFLEESTDSSKDAIITSTKDTVRTTASHSIIQEKAEEACKK